VARPVPKEWYDYKTNKINEDDSSEVKKRKEFNLSILANKKPYFFIYNYDKLKSEWNDFKKKSEDFCLLKFDCTVGELLNKENKTNDEQDFIKSYYMSSPVNLENCVMNKIARIFEEEFDTNKYHRTKGYDKEKFKSDAKYSKEEFDVVKSIKSEYDKSVKSSIKNMSTSQNTDSYKANENSKAILFNEFKNATTAIIKNRDVLCNIIVDLCYSNDNSKTFAWNLVGDVMIKNMINNTGNNIKFPMKSESGDISYCGDLFSMVEVDINENNL
jgi:hypothetical protein